MTKSIQPDLFFKQLEAVIKARRATGDNDFSYVAKLIGEGNGAVAKKVGEEATEVVIAALSEGPDKLVAESADLLFHLMLLLELNDRSLDDVAAELSNRMGLSGIEEKNSRTK